MPSPLPVLYSFRRCPYAMRARMAIRVSGMQVELREVSLRHKPEAMLRASPKGTVPVLVLPDGTVIDESLDIMSWALEQSHDPAGILSPRADALIRENDGAFKYALDRYKYPSRYPEEAATEDWKAKACTFLETLEEHARPDGLLCGRATYVNMALWPFIRQFSMVEPDWFSGAPYPRTRDWLAAWLNSALFTAIMEKHPPWSPGDVPVCFGGI